MNTPSSQFPPYLTTHGIKHEFSCPRTPPQNGVVEKKHRHVVETTIALMHQSCLPLSFWLMLVGTSPPPLHSPCALRRLLLHSSLFFRAGFQLSSFLLQRIAIVKLVQRISIVTLVHWILIYASRASMGLNIRLRPVYHITWSCHPSLRLT